MCKISMRGCCFLWSGWLKLPLLPGSSLERLAELESVSDISSSSRVSSPFYCNFICATTILSPKLRWPNFLFFFDSRCLHADMCTKMAGTWMFHGLPSFFSCVNGHSCTSGRYPVSNAAPLIATIATVQASQFFCLVKLCPPSVWRYRFAGFKNSNIFQEWPQIQVLHCPQHICVRFSIWAWRMCFFWMPSACCSLSSRWSCSSSSSDAVTLLLFLEEMWIQHCLITFWFLKLISDTARSRFSKFTVVQSWDPTASREFQPLSERLRRRHPGRKLTHSHTSIGQFRSLPSARCSHIRILPPSKPAAS